MLALLSSLSDHLLEGDIVRIVEVWIEIGLRFLLQSSSLITHLLCIIDDKLLPEEFALLELNLCLISSSLLAEYDESLSS